MAGGRERKHIIYVAVVDDDESACRSFSRLLGAAGFHAVAYSSAEELLEDEKRPQFDCFLVDIQLEGMSGLELARRLATLPLPKPVIFITALDDAQTRAEALTFGCAGYFRKTDSAELVLAAIHRAIGNGCDGSSNGSPTNTPTRR